MKLSDLIEKLKILLEHQPDVNVVIVENGFNAGGVVSYIRDLLESDILIESDLNNDLMLNQTDYDKALCIGVIHRYEQN